ncbi:MAG: hypothetical protein EOP85_03495 [Verrucomicrobiaceae bacterium]|nr:MAG: hypothetical protein EOP85_03495 [Verrucomicrobiaceae bacterium]
MNRFLALAFLLVLTACSRPAALEAVKAKWTSAGWSYVETYGKVRADAGESGHEMSSATTPVRVMSNDASTNQEKTLTQTDSQYLVVRMTNPMGEAYSVVFRKKVAP